MLRRALPTVASARVLMGKSCDLIMTSSFYYCSALFTDLYPRPPCSRQHSVVPLNLAFTHSNNLFNSIR
jgi:hypothetical protein